MNTTKLFTIITIISVFTLVAVGCTPAEFDDVVVDGEADTEIQADTDNGLAGDIDVDADADADDGVAGDVDVDSDTDNDADDSDQEVQNSVVIDITGDNFSFSQDVIEVTEGDIVTIVFESIEGYHDWVVDEFDAATDQIEAGEMTSVTFIAESAGEYEYYCSVGQHRENGMVGTLIVHPANGDDETENDNAIEVESEGNVEINM